MTRNPTAAATKLALLIDGDNISATYMPLIMREAEKHGMVAIRRIYGQFKSGKMKSWMKHIKDFDLTEVNVSPLTHGKNATDMKLVIEAMDMLSGRQLDGFCIASSDGDFTPLAVRIRASALTVYGFGAKKAPKGYKDEFDDFYECDTLLAAEKVSDRKAQPKAAAKQAEPTQSVHADDNAEPARPRRRRRSPTKAAPAPVADSAPVAAPAPAKAAPAARPAKPAAAGAKVPKAEIMEAIDAAMDDNGRAHMRSVGNRLMRTIPGFAAKTYGYKTITDLVGGLPEVELTKQGSETYVRWK